MATYPVYPATTFTQAVELTIFASNQLHDVINGDALTTVETENGDVPTLRKALVDNFYFKTPINWVEGESATVFNQLYYFDGTPATSGWYYAPQATVDNPIAMGSTPLNDDNWRLYQTATQSIPAQVYPWTTEITGATESVSPPYEFDTAIVVLNGVVLTPTRDYTISNNKINFTSTIIPEPDAEVPDILFCYIGKVQEGNSQTNYVTYNSLSATTAAGLIGSITGETVEARLSTLDSQVDPELRDDLAGSSGFSKIGQFESIESLRQYIPTKAGEVLLVMSYSTGWAAVSEPPRGGGEFYYDSLDTTTSDDGVFTIVSSGGHRYKRKGLNGRITLAQAGSPVDGTSNADEAFTRLHNAILARSDLWQVDGENLTYVRTTPLLQDISRYSVNNMYLMYTEVTDFGSDNPFYAWKPSDSIGTSKRTFTRKMKNVTFQGPGYRIDTNVHGLLLHMQTESETLRQMRFENVNVRDFNKGHVYGDHAYLITFENCNIWRCYAGLSDREIVEGASLTDSGENIRYVECLLDSLHQCANLGTQELNITFDTTSFDYTGRTSAESFIQWIIGGTHEITLRDCFIESGNINAGWYNYGFYTTAAANIRIIRGIIRLVSTTYNTCPSFFYDASGLASFEIDGTTINGWGVQKWANTGLRKFRPTLKGLTSQFTLQTTDDPILWNPTKVNNLDYQVRALTTSTYTDKYTNERIKVVPSSITKDDGTVIPTLLVTKLAGYGQFADFIVKVRKPVKVDHNASMHGKITFVPGTAMSSARVITAITGCCTPGKVNNVGVMTEFASTTITSTQLSLLDTVAWYEINASWGANKAASFLTFEEDMIRLDLSNLAAGDAIHVHSLQWFGAF